MRSAYRHLLQDELVAQDEQCKALGASLYEDESDEPETVAWGTNPFDILSAIEEDQGYPINRM